MNRAYIYRTLRFVLVIGIVIAAVYSIYYLAQITYPFLIAIAIAFMINPLVNLFEKKTKMPRALAVLVALVIIFAVFAGLITLLIAEIVSGTTYLATVVPQHLGTLVNYLENVFTNQILPLYNNLNSMFNKLDAGQRVTITENIQNIGKKITSTGGNFIKNLFGIIPNILAWLPNAATVLIFSLLATFFISKDWYKFSAIGGRILPERAKSSGRTVFVDLKRALVGFIKAQLTLVSITAVLMLVGLLILRVDYAMTIALITGIVELVPYFGTGLVFIPWIIYEFISGETKLAIGLGILYIVGIAVRQVVEPKILSSSIGLDPLATLVALFVGFELFGFLGLIIGPVALVIFGALYRARVFHDLWGFIKG